MLVGAELPNAKPPVIPVAGVAALPPKLNLGAFALGKNGKRPVGDVHPVKYQVRFLIGHFRTAETNIQNTHT